MVLKLQYMNYVDHDRVPVSCVLSVSWFTQVISNHGEVLRTPVKREDTVRERVNCIRKSHEPIHSQCL